MSTDILSADIVYSMILKNMVVADPVGNVAELISKECRRLARHRVVATTGDQALGLVKEWRPEVLLLSLEIDRPGAEKLLPKITAALPEVLILGTYRKLPEATMQQLERLGVDAFLAHPIAASDVFSVVSKRFSLPFRELHRFLADCQVRRADATEAAEPPLGHLLDLSETGMRFVCASPLTPEDVVPLHIDLGDSPSEPLPVQCRILSLSERGGVQIARGHFLGLKGEPKKRLTQYVAGLTKKLNPLAY
jgi:CheY-like chemotaxis protein